MGLMRFLCPSDSLPDDVVEQAYLAGYDRIPWRVEVRQVANELVVDRENTDSGNLYIPWEVAGHGRVTLATCSLMERAAPYNLAVELARGELAQLRNQAAEWQLSGIRLPDTLRERIAEATGRFRLASCARQSLEEATATANESLRVTLDAALELTACYAEQTLAARRDEESRLSTFLGANVGVSLLDENTSVQYLETFNAAAVPMVWREIETTQGSFYWDITDKQIEWCRKHGLTVCGGPLLLFDPWRLPQWLADFDNDFNGIVACVTEFLQTVVGRYRGSVDVWICGARMNTADALSLTEHERIRLTARAVEIIHSLDRDAERIVSFDRPWGEYLSRGAVDFSPLHFADALVRARLGLTGLMLEMNLGYLPGGTLPRDPLDVSRHLDYWSLLGIPVHVSLTLPSSSAEDPLAIRHGKIQTAIRNSQSQAEWVRRTVPLILSKGYVHGILWNQLRDSEPHDFAHGGLFDAKRNPKPALEHLAEIRRGYLR
jgi:GH35 family endo-1,4-beta-xylanase